MNSLCVRLASADCAVSGGDDAVDLGDCSRDPSALSHDLLGEVERFLSEHLAAVSLPRQHRVVVLAKFDFGEFDCSGHSFPVHQLGVVLEPDHEIFGDRLGEVADVELGLIYSFDDERGFVGLHGHLKRGERFVQLLVAHRLGQ